MKNISYYTALICMALPLFTMCGEADNLMFHEKEVGINFRMIPQKEDDTVIIRGDTIVYTFAYQTEDVTERVIAIPVEITGFSKKTDRHYAIQVKESAGTTPSVDYEALSASQTFKADLSVDSLRIRFFRNPSMEEQVKKLEITLVKGGDFIEGVSEKLFVAVQVSDILEKPVWWDHWSGAFGAWHPTKLREWFKIWGYEPLSSTATVGWMWSPKECMSITMLKKVFEDPDPDNWFYDSEGNRLTIPANF